VLLDVMMPGLDGIETFLRLRELPFGREVPIIFMTALSEKAEHDRLLALGAKGILVKPFAPLMLPQQLRYFFE
jgi:CheY-like chemotaxis protein